MFDGVETHSSSTGAQLAVRSLATQAPPRAILFVLHGLAEHSGRYAGFARSMAEIGLHVVAHDHRGHGLTTAPDAPARRFAARHGVDAVVEDCRSVRQWAAQRFGPLPHIVLGHSMGGLVAANVGRQDGESLAGLAIWNSDLIDGRRVTMGRALLRAERALKGSDTASLMFRRATFDAWRRAVPGRQTDFDWLSHDADSVAAYRQDPHCGWTPTNAMAMDILSMMTRGASRDALASWPRALPIHLLGGSADPASRKGAALQELETRLRAAGLRSVSTIVVAGARHETLQETPPYRAVAMASLAAWLARIAP